MENRESAEKAVRAGLERTIVVLLCCVGAARVFVFCAAFPFFNHVDETEHFDLVYKYSVGDLPRVELERFSPRAAELIILYRSPEYLSKPSRFGSDGFPPPFWTRENATQSEHFTTEVSRRVRRINHETASPPVYYAVAGSWCALGSAMGVDGGQLLYWIRFLNAITFAALVWNSYAMAKMLLPTRALERVGLTTMVAFFPQVVFYSINNDTLSPLLFAIALLMMLRIHFESRSLVYHIVAGLMVAATFLTKLSNVAILPVLIAVVLLGAREKAGPGAVARAKASRLYALCAAALLPIACWMLRNFVLFGSWTATAGKIRNLGWTAKSFGDLWDHPLFSLQGVFLFLGEFTIRFWHGAVLWQLEYVTWLPLELFFLGSTALFIGIACVGLIGDRSGTETRHQFALSISLFSMLISVLFLAAMSLRFDFGESRYPSREFPFFASGRLILGVLVPFLFVYFDGLARCLRKLHYAAPLIAVVTIAFVVTASEIWLLADVFRSNHNWYHLE